jgi:predicted nuclease of predicted toxin-antitoxin system
MTIVADESVDQAIVKELINRGFIIYSILENNFGINDNNVLKIANEKAAFLITEDKDFGEITFRFHSQHYGILLIRINDLSRIERTKYVCDLFEKYFEEMKGSFSVLNSKRLKIRSVHL